MRGAQTSPVTSERGWLSPHQISILFSQSVHCLYPGAEQTSPPVRTGSAGQGDEAMDVVTGSSPRRRSVEGDADLAAAQADMQSRPHAMVRGSP